MFEIDVPGKVILILVDILEYLDSINKEKFEYNDIFMLYSDGFYTDLICRDIIDKLLNPKIVKLNGVRYTNLVFITIIYYLGN